MRTRRGGEAGQSGELAAEARGDGRGDNKVGAEASGEATARPAWRRRLAKAAWRRGGELGITLVLAAALGAPAGRCWGRWATEGRRAVSCTDFRAEYHMISAWPSPITVRLMHQMMVAVI